MGAKEEAKEEGTLKEIRRMQLLLKRAIVEERYGTARQALDYLYGKTFELYMTIVGCQKDVILLNEGLGAEGRAEENEGPEDNGELEDQIVLEEQEKMFDNMEQETRAQLTDYVFLGFRLANLQHDAQEEE